MFYITGGTEGYVTFFGLGERVELIKKKKKVKFTCLKAFSDGTTPLVTPREVDLEISHFPVQMLHETALYTKRACMWFLEHCHVPTLVEIDNSRRVIFLEKSTSKNSTQVKELSRKAEAVSRNLSRFLRFCRGGTLKDKTVQKDYADWLFLFERTTGADFAMKAELINSLVDSFRKSLDEERHDDARLFIEQLYDVTDKGFICKELLADFLFLYSPQEAAPLYLEVSGNKGKTEDAIVCFEKAIRSDPTNPQFLTEIPKLGCSDARMLHCYLTGYLGCADKTAEIAHRYYRAAQEKNQKLQDAIFPLVPPPKFVWQPASVPSSPSTKRIVFTRSSQGKSPRQTDSVLEVSASAVEGVRVHDQRVKPLKSAVVRNPDDLMALEKLLWAYKDAKKWPRVEYVARILFEKLPKKSKSRFKVGEAYAHCLELQMKKAEASRVYFTLVKSEYKKNRMGNVIQALKEIYRLGGYGIFSHREKQTLCLLSTLVDMEHETAVREFYRQATLVRTSGKSDDGQHAPKGHFGKWAYFDIDHPKYVASALSWENSFVFTSTSVEVSSLDGGAVQSYPCVFPPEIADEAFLFDAKVVRWLLANGYRPVVENETCIFRNDLDKRLLIEKAEAILPTVAEYLRLDLVSAAHYELQKAYKQKREVVELYGEFLLFINKPQLVLELLSTLEKQDRGNISCLELELSAACASKAENVGRLYRGLISALQRRQADESVIRHVALHGYLYFQCMAPNDDSMQLLYNKAENNGTNWLALSASLACLEMPLKRRLVYQKLADTTAEGVYYRAKRDFERSLVSSNLTQAFVDDFAANIPDRRFKGPRDIRAFVRTELFRKNTASIQQKTNDREVVDCLLALESTDYAEVEGAFLRLNELLRSTEEQILVAELMSLWIRFSDSLQPDLNYAAFFTGQACTTLIARLKGLLAETKTESLQRMVVSLERFISERQYDHAKGCIFQMNDLTQMKPIQRLMHTLYEEYIKLPLLPAWIDNFVCQLSDSEFEPFDEGADDLAAELRAFKEGEDEGAIEGFQNNICTALSSVRLLHLENALLLATEAEDVRAGQIYRHIYSCFDEQKAPPQAIFLLCLHAFFYLQSHKRYRTASFYFDEAQRLQPDSLLFACAKMVHDPACAASEYEKIVSLCRYQKQPRLLDGYESSLEVAVRGECVKVLQSVQLATQKRLGLRLVDACIQRSLFSHADLILDKLRGCCPQSKAVIKRVVVVNVALGNIFKVTNAWQEHALLTPIPRKERALKLLLDSKELRSNEERIGELSGQEQFAYYFDQAFKYLIQGKKVEAARQLRQLQTLAYICDVDADFMLTLMKKLLEIEVLEVAVEEVHFE